MFADTQVSGTGSPGQLGAQRREAENVSRARLDGTPSSLPALKRATDVQKAARVSSTGPTSGTAGEDPRGARNLKARETHDAAAIAHELETCCSLWSPSRFLRVDAEDALRGL